MIYIKICDVFAQVITTIVSRMVAALMFHGTQFYTWFYNAFGCKLGRNTFFEDAEVRLPFMLTSGNNVVVEAGAKLETLVIMKNGDIAVDELVLGDNTVIGPNTHIGLGAKIGASCWIKSLSLVQQGRQIADSTMIVGQEVSELEQADGGKLVENRTVVSFGWHLLFLLISFIPAVMNILIVILIVFLTSSKTHTFLIAMVLYPFLVCIGQVFISVCVRLLRYLLIGKQAQPGWEIVYSKSFLRRNAATSLYHSCFIGSEDTILSYLITRFIFGIEIDFKNSFSPLPQEPDLTKIGRCTFGANGVQLRNTSFFCGGIVRYGNVNIGDHSMMLDRAVISPDTSIKKNMMVGPMTSVNEDTMHNEGTLLLGTPALTLIRKVPDVQNEITSEPMTQLLLLTLLTIYFKFLVAILVTAAFYANGVIFYLISQGYFSFSKSTAVGVSFGVFPLSIIVLVVVLLSMCLLFKWIIIGDFRKLQSRGLIPVDSWHSLRWILCNSLVHGISEVPLMLLNEFWLTATFWKLMGAKIGTNTLIDPNVLIFEADLLEIGDNCRIEEESTLLCHKFNDGGLKMDKIVIPSSCTLLARSAIFPESKITEPDTTVHALTPVNPGDTLRAGHWQGSPLERVEVSDYERKLMMSTSATKGTSIPADDIV